MLPEVYSDQSRDFQVFTKLMDLVYNSCYWETNGILYTSDPSNIKSNLLELLADKYGIDEQDASTLTDDEVRYILRCLPYLIKNKGNFTAITNLVNLYFKIYHISGDYKISLSESGTVVQDIQLADRTIILGLETLSQSTKMLQIISKYILPPGYSFFVYFYTLIDQTDNSYSDDDEASLVYRSTNIMSQIEDTMPDFIFNSSYIDDFSAQFIFTGTGTQDIFQLSNESVSIDSVRVNEFILDKSKYEFNEGFIIFYDAPQKNDKIYVRVRTKNTIKQIINAVDLSYVSSYNTDIDDSYFYGYINEDTMTNFQQLYKNAKDYDPQVKYNIGDLVKFKDGQSDIVKVYCTDLSNAPFSVKDTLSEEFIRQHSKWKDIKDGMLAIVDKMHVSDYDTTNDQNNTVTNKYYETGEIYYLNHSSSKWKWNEMKFIGSYSYDGPQPDSSEYDDYSYYCKIYNNVPILHTSNGDIQLISRGQVITDQISDFSGSDNDLVYNIKNSTYYYYLNDQWNECIEGQTYSDQLPNDIQVENNMFYRKNGGEYYIKYNNVWNKYTEPLYLLKVIQRRDYQYEKNKQ